MNVCDGFDWTLTKNIWSLRIDKSMWNWMIEMHSHQPMACFSRCSWTTVGRGVALLAACRRLYRYSGKICVNKHVKHAHFVWCVLCAVHVRWICQKREEKKLKCECSTVEKKGRENRIEELCLIIFIDAVIMCVSERARARIKIEKSSERRREQQIC